MKYYYKNIDRIFRQATSQDIKEGLAWYKEANEFCKTVAIVYDIPVWKVALVVSALSPRNKWNRNKQDTITAITKGIDGKYATFNTNRDKALNILNCNNIKEGLDILGKGQKTNAFFYNIYNTSSNVVTVDSWACRIAGYKKDTPTKKQYNVLSEAYKAVASKYNLLPSEVQAITWLCYRDRLSKVA